MTLNTIIVEPSTINYFIYLNETVNKRATVAYGTKVI